jgi:hypothetical protein
MAVMLVLIRFVRALAATITMMVASFPLFAAPTTPSVQAGRTPQAPPVPPPIETRAEPTDRHALHPQGPGDTLNSIGQPTDEEQLYLEYINRSRADPPAEGARLANTTDPDVLSAYDFFSVDLALMESQFNAISPVPPVAMNVQLMAAARLHSGDMFTNQFQGHVGSTGSTLGMRVTAQGYNWSTLGENVYSYAETVWHGHAGFNVDWGPGPGGMQTPPGHRNSIHNGGLREVGVGIVNGVNGSVGPQLVTQDFGTRLGATPLVTGVVYYDFNGNSFYDVGEGIGGVNVEVEPSTFYAVTANSGGYAVPVPGNGIYTVTFTANGMATNQQTVTVSSSRNIKADYLPVFSPPVVTGPDHAALNQDNTYAFTSVGAATGHQWEQTRVAPFTAVEGAENGLTDFMTNVSSGYSVVVSSPRASGSFAFHLAHPNPVADQILTYARILLPGPSGQIRFNSRLGTATPSQVARVQVSVDQSATWEEIYTQPGADQPGETGFSLRSVSLSNFAGRPIQVRFLYDYTGGGFFPQITSGVGWYIDDISFGDTEELTGSAITDIASGNSFVFAPTSAGDYLLHVRGKLPGRLLPWGPVKRVIASASATPVLTISGAPALSGGQVQIDFDVGNYQTGMSFQLWKASDLSGTWAVDSAAIFQPLVPNTRFRATTPAGTASQGFYRVRTN